jgi:hypothetical protein
MIGGKMSLANDVAGVFARLALHWDALFRRVGLADFTDLRTLQDPLAINREIAGFEDFAPQATRAIEPGDPALSLIYHALASPCVHPTAVGPKQPRKRAHQQAYATLAELDLIENYIYSLKPFDLRDLGNLTVAPFAYEYRPAASTTHRTHADLVFSRTGVARVGNEAMVWSGAARSFLNHFPGRPGTFAVMPARYGIFLAERRRGIPENISFIGDADKHDSSREFLFPIRKLFSGPECLPGADLEVSLKEYHRAEKLKGIVTRGKLKLRKGFDENAPPLFRESGQADPLVELEEVSPGGSVLVSPPPGELVRFAQQKNASSGELEYVSFKVPAASIFIREFSHNRHYTSLMVVENWFTFAPEVIIGLIPNAPHLQIAAHNVPNFVNIRHEVSDPSRMPIDLNDPANPPAGGYRHKIRKGGYWAAMFEDGICDGSVWPEIRGLPGDMEIRSAFSLVTAPDFFATADEQHLNYHSDVIADQFSSGGPAPLCEGRYPVNPEVLRPRAYGSPSLDTEDETLVAVVGRVKEPATSIQILRERSERTSYLSDAASNHFAPGWDVTVGGSAWKKFYTTAGLGSPFPEDVKLCAASNSFWPAAAPDASRTFDRQATPTAIPMMDAELGYHRDNPDKPPDAPIAPGWDGEYGPFFEYVATGKQKPRTERVVNFCDIWRSDYVRNARLKLFRPDPFLGISSDELIARMECLALCIKALPPLPHAVRNTKLWLVTAQRVKAWEKVPEHHRTLSGPGYKFAFVQPTLDAPTRVPSEPTRLRQRIERTGYICHVTPDDLYWSTDGNVFRHFVCC